MAKPLETVADYAFFAAGVEKELIARVAWSQKFGHLLDRPIHKSVFRPFDLPSIPCEPVDHTGKYAVKRIDYDKQHLETIARMLGDRADKPIPSVMYPLTDKEEAVLAGDKKELLPEIRKMRDNKTEYHDRFRDHAVGEKVARGFVNKADKGGISGTYMGEAAATEAAAEGGPAPEGGPAAAAELPEPVTFEGNPRRRYLKRRNEKYPDEKFRYCVTEQQRYGWNLATEMPADKIHGSKFARIQVLEGECFRDNCIQYPEDHLDTGRTMPDHRLNAADSKTTYGIANPDKW